MSDHKFTGFDIATIADAVRQPPLDDLASAAQARQRRRPGALALATVVLVLGTAALPMAIGTPWDNSPPPPHMSDRTTELFITGVDSAVGVQGTDNGCTLRFARTNDNGLSWTESADNRYHASTCSPGPDFSPLEYFVLGQRTYLVLDNGKWHLSTDYGHTWQDSDRAIVNVPAFPADARAVYCEQRCHMLRQPVAVDPTTGAVYRLSSQSSPFRQSSVYPASDGSIWVTWTDVSGAVVVSRSIDQGATWNTWQLPKGPHMVAVAAANQREAYLLIEPPPSPGVSSQLLHTTDGGTTWTDVATDLPTSPESRQLTIGSDGSLLVAQFGTMRPDNISSLLVSRDEGRHFTLGREYNGKDGLAGVAPGHAWLYGRSDMAAQGVNHAVITQDGSSWTFFPLPS